MQNNKSKHTLVPKSSASPDQKATFDPTLYSDSRKSSLSRMNRRSLREINNPHDDGKVGSSQNSDVSSKNLFIIL